MVVSRVARGFSLAGSCSRAVRPFKGLPYPTECSSVPRTLFDKTKHLRCRKAGIGRHRSVSALTSVLCRDWTISTSAHESCESLEMDNPWSFLNGTRSYGPAPWSKIGVNAANQGNPPGESRLMPSAADANCIMQCEPRVSSHREKRLFSLAKFSE
jgi:hypothetical protein